jgi:hypothetical protein
MDLSTKLNSSWFCFCLLHPPGAIPPPFESSLFLKRCWFTEKFAERKPIQVHDVARTFSLIPFIDSVRFEYLLIDVLSFESEIGFVAQAKNESRKMSLNRSPSLPDRELGQQSSSSSRRMSSFRLWTIFIVNFVSSRTRFAASAKSDPLESLNRALRGGQQMALGKEFSIIERTVHESFALPLMTFSEKAASLPPQTLFPV